MRVFLCCSRLKWRCDLILPLLLFLWLFIALLGPMRASFFWKRVIVHACVGFGSLKAVKCLVLPDDERFGGMMVRYVPVRLVGLVM